MSSEHPDRSIGLASLNREEPERNRIAVTLVELLVVLAIIGTMLALLLPAIQGSRTRALEAVCQNHLRQITTAMAHLVLTQKHIPNPPKAGYAGGWSVDVLDYMEARALRDLIGTICPLSSVPEVACRRPVVMSCPGSSVRMSFLPSIEAAHYVLITPDDDKAWCLSDAPLPITLPWLAVSHYREAPWKTLEGPHNRGFQVARSDGSVELWFPGD